MPDIPKSDEKQLAPADGQRSVAPRSILASRGLELALNVRQGKKRDTVVEGKNYEGDADPVRLLLQEAEQGDADAQFSLGFMYAKGIAVPQDDVEAARWFRLSAEQGDADAQFMLGDAYAEGRGVPQDSDEAVRWCWQAARQGHADAQFHLGYFYADFPRCKFCEKLIGEVVAATNNPTKDPHRKGGRPFHCSCRQCYHTQNEKTVNCYWKIYPNPEEAKKAGHERSCSTCIS